MALFSGLPVPQWESPGDRSAQAVQGNQQRLQMFQQSRMKAMDRQAELNDPFRELKALQMRTQIKASAAQIAESELSRRIKENTIESEAMDKLAFTNLITAAKGDEDKLLEGLANTQFMSPMGRDSATQMRLAAVARKSRDAFSKALGKLTPQGIARVSQFEAGSPEAWKAIQDEDALSKPTSTLGKILSDRAAAKAAGRTDEVAIFDAEIAARGAKDGMTITTDDEGNSTIQYRPKETQFETITEKFPEVEGSPAQPAKPATKGLFGIGAKPATPAVPAVPASPERTVTRKVPVDSEFNDLVSRPIGPEGVKEILDATKKSLQYTPKKSPPDKSGGVTLMNSPSDVNIQNERAQAAQAISAGKDPSAVKERFKQRTGQDL